jgi:holin-like protein
MLGFFVLVLALLLVGDLLSTLVLPIVPGPIVGMGLLLVFLIVRRGVPPSFVAPANGLVGFLTLFILPASLGILADWQQLGDDWPMFVAVAAAGAVVSAGVVAVLAAVLVGRRAPTEGEHR